MHCWRITITTLILATAALAADPATEPQKLPYTIAKETTGITEPLNPDGSPDYIASINNIKGKGITPENNGYVDFLQVLGTDGLDEKIRGQMLELTGAKPSPPETPVWRPFGFKKDEDRAPEQQAFIDLHFAPWKAEQNPAAADFLSERGVLLDRAVKAAMKPQWWVPVVAPADHHTLVAMVLPNLAGERDVAQTLAVRAMLRAGSGDFDGFLADITAVKRLAYSEATGFTVIERLVGGAISSYADESIASIAATGKLTPEQCAKLLAMLNALPKSRTMAEALDTCERWSMLEEIELTAVGNSPDISVPMERSRVNWDDILRRANALMDYYPVAMKMETLAKASAAMQGYEDQIKQMEKNVVATGSPETLLKPGLAESRDAYTKRVGDVVLRVFVQGMNQLDEIHRRTIMQDDMMKCIVLLAQAKAADAPWPAAPALPTDIYTDAPVQYAISSAGIRLYSVGRNKKDNGGGRYNPPACDDIGVGVEPASP